MPYRELYMEQNNTTNHEVERYDKYGQRIGTFVTRLMTRLHRKPMSESLRVDDAVVYRGSGASLLGDNPGITSKEQADIFIGELLGRN